MGHFDKEALMRLIPLIMAWAECAGGRTGARWMGRILLRRCDDATYLRIGPEPAQAS